MTPLRFDLSTGVVYAGRTDFDTMEVALKGRGHNPVCGKCHRDLTPELEEWGDVPVLFLVLCRSCFGVIYPQFMRKRNLLVASLVTGLLAQGDRGGLPGAIITSVAMGMQALAFLRVNQGNSDA